MSILKRISAPVKDRRGELMVDVLFQCLIIIVFIMTLTEFYGIFMKVQNMNFIARRLTRSVEISGTVSGLSGEFDTLCGELGLTGASMQVDAAYCDGVSRIQLRETFKVTVRYTYYFNIFAPDNGSPLRISIPLTVSLTGMSEVYTRI